MTNSYDPVGECLPHRINFRPQSRTWSIDGDFGIDYRINGKYVYVSTTRFILDMTRDFADRGIFIQVKGNIKTHLKGDI